MNLDFTDEQQALRTRRSTSCARWKTTRTATRTSSGRNSARRACSASSFAKRSATRGCSRGINAASRSRRRLRSCSCSRARAMRSQTSRSSSSKRMPPVLRRSRCAASPPTRSMGSRSMACVWRTRRVPEGARDHRAVREGPQAIRQADRRVSGDLALPRRRGHGPRWQPLPGLRSRRRARRAKQLQLAGCDPPHLEELIAREVLRS